MSKRIFAAAFSTLVSSIWLQITTAHEQEFQFNQAAQCCPTLPHIFNESSVKTCLFDQNTTQCPTDCIFKEEGLMYEDKDGSNTINKTALNRKLSTLAVDAWKPVINQAQKNCSENTSVVKPESTCTSGAAEVSTCLFKVMATNCPYPSSNPTCKNYRPGGSSSINKGLVNNDSKGFILSYKYMMWMYYMNLFANFTG